MKWYKLSPPPSGISVQQIAGKKIGIVRTLGQIHVFQTRCPHAGADLSAGWCEKNQIICPIHRHSYDLDTGRGAEGQGDYIRIYPVREEAGDLFVGIKKPWWQWILGNGK